MQKKQTPNKNPNPASNKNQTTPPSHHNKQTKNPYKSINSSPRYFSLRTFDSSLKTKPKVQWLGRPPEQSKCHATDHALLIRVVLNMVWKFITIKWMNKPKEAELTI